MRSEDAHEWQATILICEAARTETHTVSESTLCPRLAISSRRSHHTALQRQKTLAQHACREVCRSRCATSEVHARKQ